MNLNPGFRFKTTELSFTSSQIPSMLQNAGEDRCQMSSLGRTSYTQEDCCREKELYTRTFWETHQICLILPIKHSRDDFRLSVGSLCSTWFSNNRFDTHIFHLENDVKMCSQLQLDSQWWGCQDLGIIQCFKWPNKDHIFELCSTSNIFNCHFHAIRQILKVRR